MPGKSIQWLVVTDLDGTLLNHHTYDTAGIAESITMLKQYKIPVVLNTSKTFAETLTIREQLGIDDPFVVENGSCLYLPAKDFEKPQGAEQRDDYWELVLGCRKSSIDQVLDAVEGLEQQCIRLSQCSIQQAVELTGLTESQAEQAIAREFSEPLIWQSDETSLQTFKNKIEESGLSTIQGGRFLHITGQCDKGIATQHLTQLYQQPVKTMALGDSANDAQMLTMADISVVVNSPSNSQLEALITPSMVTQQVAPQGWCEAIEQMLVTMQMNQE